MYQKAKNPDRIVEKIYECRYFLALMADYEEKLDAEKLLYCLSAFLSAFRTSAFRLYGVTEHKLGRPASRALQTQLRSHPEIGFLLSRTNVEVHEDGVVVHPQYALEVIEGASSRWAPKMVRDPSRWRSLNRSRYGEAVVARRAAGWQFAGNPRRELSSKLHTQKQRMGHPAFLSLRLMFADLNSSSRLAWKGRHKG
jgi:hypothetical protein